MTYSDPKLRDLLAGDYVLGLMPARAKARFERLMAADAALARLVAEWSERLAPIDGATQPVTPPARVWRAIEAKTAARPMPRGSLFESLVFWRGLAAAAAAVAAALVLYIAVGRAPETVVAVLADSSGTPAFIATRTTSDEVAVAPVRQQSLEAQKSFELWAIAGGAPKPLGLVSAKPGQSLVVPASALAAGGTVLAVSLEPAGGSPTGLPTGPVLFQGRVLAQ
jgi:anti-sigma-K factor RskA